MEIRHKYLPQAKKKCCECEREFDMFDDIENVIPNFFEREDIQGVLNER